METISQANALSDICMIYDIKVSRLSLAWDLTQFMFSTEGIERVRIIMMMKNYQFSTLFLVADLGQHCIVNEVSLENGPLGAIDAEQYSFSVPQIIYNKNLATLIVKDFSLLKLNCFSRFVSVVLHFMVNFTFCQVWCFLSLCFSFSCSKVSFSLVNNNSDSAVRPEVKI